MKRSPANRVWSALRGAAAHWRRDEHGLAAAEFAMVLPLLMVLYIGGFEFAQATSIYRKMSDLDVILANVMSQDIAEQPTAIDLENTAAAQVMAPFDTTPLTVVAMEVTTDKTFTGSTAGHGVVNWSRSLRGGASAPCVPIGTSSCATGAGTPYVINTPLTTLPSSLAPNTSYILIQTYYNYQVAVGAQLINPIPLLSSQLFYLPRGTSTITCTSCT